MDIGDGGIFTDPDAVIEDAADVFGEMSIDERIDDSDGKRIDQIKFFHLSVLIVE